MTEAAQQLLGALEQAGCRPRKSSRGWVARCPAHDDRRPSLSVAVGDDGRVLVYCHAGCTPEAMVAALGLTMRELMPEGHRTRGREWKASHVGRVRRVASRLEPPVWDFGILAAKLRVAADSPRLIALVRWLPGTTPDALFRLRVGWDANRQALAFPMVDAAGRTIGLQYRSAAGQKWCARGSRLGLFVPERLLPFAALCIAEGASDCAALLSLGFPAIGRASCHTGADMVCELVRRLQPVKAVVVSDGDTAGQRGGRELAQQLAGFVHPILWRPPAGYKDLRSYAAADSAWECRIREQIAAYAGNH